jgi:hypothetical protein
MYPTIVALTAQLERYKKENAELKKVVCAKAPGPLGVIQSIGDDLLRRQNGSNEWHDSTLEAINDLKPDYAGKVGERLIQQLCMSGLIKCEYTEDKNSTDGTYDIKMNDKKVEIKTARLGVNGSFQHETLKTSGYDYILFVDITPNYFYITLLPRFDMNERHPIIGRKPHPRKGTSDVFKLDFGESNIQRSILNDTSLKVDANVSMDTVISFLTAKCNV